MTMVTIDVKSEEIDSSEVELIEINIEELESEAIYMAVTRC